MGGQWKNNVATRATALSRQQKVMADSQLALNHCLTTTFASATSTATRINLRLWPGRQRHIKLRGCEAYQSINLSLPTSLTSSCHCRNQKKICDLLIAVGSRFFFFFFSTKRFMWLSAYHHVIAAFLPAVLFSYCSSCLRQTWTLFVTHFSGSLTVDHEFAGTRMMPLIHLNSSRRGRGIQGPEVSERGHVNNTFF